MSDDADAAPDVVVLRGAPDALELAALLVALSVRAPAPAAAAPSPAPGGPRRGRVVRDGPRGLGTTDRYWPMNSSPW